MTNSIRNSALLALICIAFRLNCLSIANPGMPTGPQNGVAGGSVDNSQHGPVWVLTEYACQKGTLRSGSRQGLMSEVMQRGTDSQPGRVLYVKGKTGEVASLYVLNSDCSGEQANTAPGAASFVLMHRIRGEDEYYYAVSGQAECLRAFQLRSLGQFVPVDMSTKLQDCQNEVRLWLGQAASWHAQAKSGTSKP
jgi:hypothetical protein